MSTLGNWHYYVDRDATLAAYAQTAHGGAEKCACDGCRNFLLARGQVFPVAFLKLLKTLGIDPRKEGEVYRNGRIAQGQHDYAGWYHFVGLLSCTEDFPAVYVTNGFSVLLQRSSAPALERLKGQPLVQLDFHAERVPWMLQEAEPE